MKALKLNRALVLEDAYRVPDNAGGYTTQWQALGTLWAQVRPGSGRAYRVDALPLSRVPLRIIVRAAPDGAPSRPKAGQRFREGNRIYLIRAVTEHDQAAHYLRCHAEEEVVA